MPKREVAPPVKPRPARRPAKRPGRRPPAPRGSALLRYSIVGLWAAMLVGAVPPVRALALLCFDAFAATSVRVGGSVVEAIATSRRGEEHRSLIAGYAARYRIPLELARAIDEAAAREGIDPELGFRLVRVESGFKQRAVSSAGALGYTQLMPATAAGMQPGITEEQIFDRDTNLRLGFRYLRWLLKTYDGRVEEALHAYNRGPGTVDRIRARGGDPANGYADRVLGRNRPEAYRGNGFVSDRMLHAESWHPAPSP